MKIGDLVGKPVHTSTGAPSTLVLPNAKVGVEVEVENCAGVPPTNSWESVVDNSLRNNGMEFITRGGLVGVQLELAIEEICELAKEYGWSEGMPRAGIHIHLDCTDFDMARGELARFMVFYLLLEHALFRWAGNWRRNCGFCGAWSEYKGSYDTLGKIMFDTEGKVLTKLLKSGGLSKYQAVNILPLHSLGTIEMRHLPTTFDKNRILTWINMILQIKKAAKEYDGSPNVLKTISSRGITEFCQDIMGPLWEQLLAHFCPSSAWEAVDNTIALMSAGGAVARRTKSSPDNLWDTPSSNWAVRKLSRMKGDS